MANIIASEDVIHNYTYSLGAGDVLYFRMNNFISGVIVEIQFFTTGEATVYDCINTYDELTNAFYTLAGESGQQTALDALNWIVWDLGTITDQSADHRLVGVSPAGFKVTNSGASEIKVLVKGNR